MSSLATISSAFWASYTRSTDKHVKMIDVFMAFALVTALAQFLYCSLVGTFPFNSFLAGFGCALGAFVLAGSCARALFYFL